MGRKLEEATEMRHGDIAAPEIPPDHGSDLSEEKKKKKKKSNRHKKNDEEKYRSQSSPENGSHSKESPALDNSGDSKKASKKRKLVENAERNGKHAEHEEQKEKPTKKKREEKECNVHDQKKRCKENDEKDGGESQALEGVNTVNGAVLFGTSIKDSKYKALESFDDSGLPSVVLNCCKTFSKPSPIQAHAWPFLLDGRDFIGIAATGSGKTLAYGVPALMHILRKVNNKNSKKAVPRCLVLAPTRELAQQIAGVLRDAGSPCDIKLVCLYGGMSKGPQISSTKAGVDIVIGTPGRLKDLIEMGVCCLKEVSFVVLDEADRMLDMGFEPEVRSILSQTSSVRQIVMFSATWPLAVHQLAQEFMDTNTVKVVVGSQDLAANHDVMQIVEVVEDRARDARLVALLEKYHQSQRNRVLVFVLYKKEAARVENMLQNRGWKVVSVHGDKAQHDRNKALSLFKEGKSPLMIATDVASRGLDIPDVEVVINYSYPLTTEDYVHRIGRTGRAGKKGVAHTFFTKENKGLAGELVNVLREAEQIVPAALSNFGTHVKKKESKLYGSHFKEITADAPKATKITFSNSDDED
ncbi:DEAD-box ATP-dependent RNA helicase 5 [Apostasia shenzhenica]|uniref:RNA helicase n=1 Tax=Apostasia shenzhenica TaxID=1088818 RepID=A0A2I0ATG8_9ASPA|nr:DEAD-box ATP-dependent RNA helicase 5 [Apostasia shenzhenica]